MCVACRLEPNPEQKPVEVAHLGLHAHTCSECGKLRTCYVNPCAFRGRYLRRATDPQFVCFVCVDAVEAAAEREAA